MALVINALPISYAITRDLEFSSLVRAAAYKLVLAMGYQENTAAGRTRMDLVMRIVVQPDPGLQESMVWAIAAMPPVVQAYEDAARDALKVPDAVYLAAVEQAWRLYAALTATGAVPPGDLVSDGNPPLLDPSTPVTPPATDPVTPPPSEPDVPVVPADGGGSDAGEDPSAG